MQAHIITLFITISVGLVLHAQDVTQWVNPFIGTSNFGTTNPGAIVPQGMVSVVPFNVTGSDSNRWDKDAQWWSTPYSYDNSFLTGFSHVNLSGVGCPDLGVILLMPTVGDTINADLRAYGSLMNNQRAIPGYYSCDLSKYDIHAEATSTLRTGISRYTFPKGEVANILIDLGNGLSNESGANIRIINEKEVEGWRMVGNFCYNAQAQRPVYFVAQFSQPAKQFGVWKKMPKLEGAESSWSSVDGQYNYYKQSTQPISGDEVGAYFQFTPLDNEKILVKVGVSYVSIDNARENLKVEQPLFEFDKIKEQAHDMWEKSLSMVEVEGGSDNDKTIFYTALYHTQIHPNIFNDVNGEYPLMEGYGLGTVKQGNRYTTFSLWDTYRNFHPLMSLLYPRLQTNFVRSMIAMYKESGWLPKWELNGMETYTMNGDPAFPVISDTYLRGLTDFDVTTAYEAMYKHYATPSNANKIRKNNDFYLQNLYVPLVSEFDNSTSEALELYIADWNFAQLAKKLGKKADYQKLMKQAMGYKNYFDDEYKMIRPKSENGKFIENFNPKQGENFEPVPGFHEGTAWQYTFGIPYDVKGLAQLMGGDKIYVERLQMVFDEGLFDMANEPDINYPYFFNYFKGEEWRAQAQVTRLINTYFTNSPGGIPGNDDCGTMSAWLVFSMMGIYPVCPGSMDYAIVSPLFDKITVHLNQEYYKGKTFVIEKQGNGQYIQSTRLNQQPHEGYFIHHNDITQGGELKIIK